MQTKEQLLTKPY